MMNWIGIAYILMTLYCHIYFVASSRSGSGKRICTSFRIRVILARKSSNLEGIHPIMLRRTSVAAPMNEKWSNSVYKMLIGSSLGIERPLLWVTSAKKLCWVHWNMEKNVNCCIEAILKKCCISLLN